MSSLVKILGSRVPTLAVGASLAMLLLGGCGQKGPLYLPAPPASASAPTTR